MGVLDGKVAVVTGASAGSGLGIVTQGTAQGAGMGSTDWDWDPEHAAAAHARWTELGLMNQAIGRYAGQEVEAIGDVHLFIVTRPRTQKMDTVYGRSF